MITISFADCECNMNGSRTAICNDAGKCDCYSNVVGDKCDECKDNFFGFPDCQRKFKIILV